MKDILSQIESMANDTICLIYEPLVQGAAGMLMHNPEELSQLMKCCRMHGILLIQDEVFTGFGRTGKLFAADYLTEKPDIMCFSKGLTGGTMPMGITSCSEDIFNAFLSEDQHRTLFHGHSFTANPLACTAALASMELLLLEETQRQIRMITEKHARFAEVLKSHPLAEEVRQTGTVLAWNLASGQAASYFSNDRQKIYEAFLVRGIIMRPLGNIMYLVPPYCITEDKLEFLYRNILEVLDLFQGG
ncbi:adenosylmethionine-8-amino-7-oxononanoate aminotransferase [Chryseobacterium sp. SORGH_AS1175]|nr:adenosylmethionine-8-amino-7-oxononanoate aminotransferase [Chryseobacterium sp. SORGH_AS_1175]